MLHDLTFQTDRKMVTRFCVVAAWEQTFSLWFKDQGYIQECNHIVILTDAQVWQLYEGRTREGLSTLGKTIVPLVLEPGEDSKNFDLLPALIKDLVANRVHRRDMIVCFGGGVACDIGGLLALLYMRGLPYVNVPTSLMAQIDAAIGGKVGTNFGLRKNLLGGFYHPLLVLMDPGLLASLPDRHYRSALAEATKVAIILQDDRLFSLLEEGSEALLRRQPHIVGELVERCVLGKLSLLKDDPFEENLERSLNLGHAVAHALERLPIMTDGRQPLHGEAVAIGLAATIRYAFRRGLCSPQRAVRLLQILKGLGLPVQPGGTIVSKDEIWNQLSRISEHRGGLLRFVLPVDPNGVRIQPEADLDLLMECLSPINDLA
jgi:3-dehydroquinate synthase